MSYYFISVGGTGAKILEALTHLSVAGVLPGAEELNVIDLDPDTGNGNLARTKSTLEQIEKFQDVQIGAGSALLKNKLKIWKPFPFNPLPKVGANLDQVMNAAIIAHKPLGQLYGTLYSRRERLTPLDVGFRGHPSIGAAVLAKQYTDPKNHQWDELKAQISGETGAAKSVKVFLAGSIFGGTGAAGIPTIARLLRNMFGANISIGGVFMLPYFMFIADGKKDLFAKSENFLTGAKAALKYYSQGDKDFDEMYFLGDNAVVNSDFSIGGPQQRNDAHIVDLYGALAAVDFFGKAIIPGTVNYNYICRDESGKFKWSDLQGLAPDFKKLFIQFSRFILTYTQLIKPTLDNPPKVTPRWYGASVEGESPAWYLPIAYSEDGKIHFLAPDADKITEFNRYAVSYCTWLKQLEILSSGRTVSLINPIIFNVTKKIFVDAENFKWCDPDEPKGGLELNDISTRLANTAKATTHAPGFGRLLRHVYDSCEV